MGHRYQEIAFTDRVKDLQSQRGSRDGYAKREDGPAQNHLLTRAEAAFIAERDSFYMATVSATGWPYVQHRGGAPGFVRVLDERTLGFADFAGNRQYVSLGNLAEDSRVSLFFMDYANQTRLKLFGWAELADPSNAELMKALEVPGYRGRIERGMLIRIEAFDWNCPQHITPRYTDTEVQAVIEPLKARIGELEAKLGRSTQTD